MKTTGTEQFPIGGPRQAVYDALRSRGFMMAKDWPGDKHWSRVDGLKAHVYGTGSMLRVIKDGAELIDAPMADALAFIDKGDASSERGR